MSDKTNPNLYYYYFHVLQFIWIVQKKFAVISYPCVVGNESLCSHRSIGLHPDIHLVPSWCKHIRTGDILTTMLESYHISISSSIMLHETWSIMQYVIKILKIWWPFLSGLVIVVSMVKVHFKWWHGRKFFYIRVWWGCL